MEQVVYPSDDPSRFLYVYRVPGAELPFIVAEWPGHGGTTVAAFVSAEDALTFGRSRQAEAESRGVSVVFSILPSAERI